MNRPNANSRLGMTIYRTIIVTASIIIWLVAILVFYVLYSVIPRAKIKLVDSGAEMSDFQVRLIRASDWFANYVYLGIPLLLAAAALTVMLLNSMTKSPVSGDDSTAERNT